MVQSAQNLPWYDDLLGRGMEQDILPQSSSLPQSPLICCSVFLGGGGGNLVGDFTKLSKPSWVSPDMPFNFQGGGGNGTGHFDKSPLIYICVSGGACLVLFLFLIGKWGRRVDMALAH